MSLQQLSLPPHWQHRHESMLSSTMNMLAEVDAPEAGVLLLTCDDQTAGRGQRGNHWESKAGMNLTFSFVFRPLGIPAQRQFLLSQAVAMAAHDVLTPLGEGFSVKWPNDIYWGDSKLGGMLLEHHWAGATIARTLVGLGLNVNQTAFLSDAPNPVSLRQIMGHELSRATLLEAFVQHFELRLAQAVVAPTALSADYHAALYRREGWHGYRDVLRGEDFSAELLEVAPDGYLHLLTDQGEQRRYAFKEVQFLAEAVTNE